MFRLGLRGKFVIVIVLILTILLGVIAAILIRNTSTNLRNDLNAQSKLFSELATKPIGDSFLIYQTSGTERILEQTQRFTDLNSNVTNVAVVDTSGKTIFSQNRDQSSGINSNQASSFNPIYIYDSSRLIKRIITPLIEDTGVHRYNLVYSISTTSVQRRISQTERYILLLALTGLALSAAITYLLVFKLFLEPIRTLRNQALIISDGDLNQQVAIKTKDEIGDLAIAVNYMANVLKADIIKLHETDRLKTEFMLITSHNLRTPLTIINGYLELVSAMHLDSKLREMFDKIAASARELAALAEDTLAISQIEAGKNIIDKQPTELGNFLQLMANDFESLAKQKDIHFIKNIEVGSTIAHIGQQLVRSALWNVLDNALKFTKSGGTIKLDANISGNHLKIIVSDTGIGISPLELPKLFTKFHRGTSTLQYDYEGTGIGLYATKLVIEKHGGSIKAESVYGHGATFTILLPLSTE